MSTIKKFFKRSSRLDGSTYSPTNSNSDFINNPNPDSETHSETHPDPSDDFNSINSMSVPTLNLASDSIEFAATLGSTALVPVGKFIPLIADVANIVEQFVQIYEVAQHNRRICGVLLDRVSSYN